MKTTENKWHFELRDGELSIVGDVGAGPLTLGKTLGAIKSVVEERDLACAEATDLSEDLDIACAEATRLAEELESWKEAQDHLAFRLDVVRGERDELMAMQALDQFFAESVHDFICDTIKFEPVPACTVGTKLIEKSSMKMRKVVDVVEELGGGFFYQVSTPDGEWSKCNNYISEEELLEKHCIVKEIKCQS